MFKLTGPRPAPVREAPVREARQQDLSAKIGYKLVEADDMAAAKNHGTANRAFLLESVFTRHPIIVPYPPFPPQLAYDARLIARHKARGEMSLLNAAFERLWLHNARVHAEHKHVQLWHKEVHLENEEWARYAIDRELWHRRLFFRQVYAIAIKREHRLAKARHLQLAIYAFIERFTLKHRLHDNKETHDVTLKAAARHAAFLAWRLDNLYAVTDTGSFVRVKHHGKAVENIVGELLWQLRAHVTHQHHEWRIDNLYSALANGGLKHLHHLPGISLEAAVAQIHARLQERRHKQAQDWHALAQEIVTPNHGIVHVKTGGEKPEAATSRLWVPKLAIKHELDDHWHANRLQLALANGGMAHATKQLRGLEPETLAARHHSKKREKVTAAHAEFHRNHFFGPTPNHGFAPLKGHGKALEGVAAAAADRPKRKTTEAFHDWHLRHLFKMSANHQMVPVKSAIGQSWTKVTSDVLWRVRDITTRRLWQLQLANLYTPTENGGFRRLAKSGKGMGHTHAQIAEPVEGTEGKHLLPYKDGRELPAARLGRHADEVFGLKLALRHVQAAVAAHEQTVSRLHDHSVRLNSNQEATNADTLPAVVVTGTKNRVS